MSANYLFKGIKNNTIPMIVKSGHVGTAIPGEWIIYPGRATAGWAEHAKPSLLDRRPVGAESSLLDRHPAAIKQRISNIEVEYRSRISKSNIEVRSRFDPHFKIPLAPPFSKGEDGQLII
jgi:hypothetical protein